MAHSVVMHGHAGSAKTGATAHDEERHRRFGEDIDALKRRTFARLGSDDVAYVVRVDRVSRALEIVGRVLIHVSLDPLTFLLGTFALSIHKQLQTAEIGHSALHGAWDGLAGAEKFASTTYRWRAPIDEASWKYGHNVRHHGNTNIAGKDPDIRFGPACFTERTQYAWHNRLAIPFVFVVLAPNFRPIINLHVTGVNDAWSDNGLPGRLDFLPDRSKESVRGALRSALRKYVPYYLVEYLLFPALAGPFFWKVAMGNALSETASNLYTAATILCGHVGDDVKNWPEGTRPRSRGEWYAMQVEAASDFEVSLPLSILCGGLDRQIEHHLFPTLPPPRLREIAGEVREICARHGVSYETDTWGRRLRKALTHIARLARRGGPWSVVRAMA
jgi:NADPH-dependent stearoyl-CoA 9-desaturase